MSDFIVKVNVSKIKLLLTNQCYSYNKFLTYNTSLYNNLFGKVMQPDGCPSDQK